MSRRGLSAEPLLASRPRTVPAAEQFFLGQAVSHLALAALGAVMAGADVDPPALLPGPVVTLQPGTVYRARIVLRGEGYFGSNDRIADELAKLGLAGVTVWSLADAPADWPASQRVDDSGTFQKTRLAEGTWPSNAAPKALDTTSDSRVMFRALWAVPGVPGAPAAAVPVVLPPGYDAQGRLIPSPTGYDARGYPVGAAAPAEETRSPLGTPKGLVVGGLVALGIVFVATRGR